MIERIQVHGRRFGYQYGVSFLAIKEYRHKRRLGELLMSFAVPLPEGLVHPHWGTVDRGQIRALILQRMGAATRECVRWVN